MNTPFRLWAAIATAVLLVITGPLFAAEDYPQRPIQLVVGYPPGGINDIAARIVAERLTSSLGQPVIVENQAGAGGTMGANRVAKAKPDGYTLLMGTVSNIIIAPSQYKALPYDPIKDFAPIARVAASPNILSVNPEFPVNSLKDLVALAKQKPSAISYASAGVGGTSHLTMELIKSLTAINLVHVPYKGDGPASFSVIAGEVPVAFSTLATALPHIKAGKLRPIGVSSAKRSSLLRDVPTISESSGLGGFDLDVWVGVFAPSGTPKDIVDKLNAEIMKITQLPAVRERFLALGAEPADNTSEQFAAYIRSEMTKWSRAAAVAGIKPE